MFTDCFFSILVLKEGQIVESGSFRELLAQNGIFATMWADQISADDEVVDRSSYHKDAISGYTVDQESKLEETELRSSEAPQPTLSDVASPEPQNPFADPIAIDFAETIITTESPQLHQIDLSHEPSVELKVSEPVDVETAQLEGEAPKSEAEPLGPEVSGDNSGLAAFPTSEPTAFPTSEPTTAFPISEPTAFPTSEPAAEPTNVPSPIEFPASPQPEVATSPGVTFGAGLTTPPRSGTPDLEGRPKRIRKTSQNIQKFARTLSFAARRQSSGTGSSVTKVESPRTSREESSVTRGEGSVGGDSTEASVTGEDKKEAKGKGKKSKKSRSGTR